MLIHADNDEDIAGIIRKYSYITPVEGQRHLIAGKDSMNKDENPKEADEDDVDAYDSGFDPDNAPIDSRRHVAQRAGQQ